MKENLYTGILDGIGEIIEGVSDDIAKEFKGTIPFDTKPVSKKEIMAHFNEMPLEERIRILGELQGRE